MKTRTILLLCLFLGMGLSRISAQTDVYNFPPTPSLFPVSCDGVTVDVVSYSAPFKWLTHSQHGTWTWVKAMTHWTFTSTVTGETFKVIEKDPGTETNDPETGQRLYETGTLHAIMIGDQGSHYNITWAYKFIEADMSWSLSFVSAKCH
jgi:hypothetical protein